MKRFLLLLLTGWTLLIPAGNSGWYRSLPT